MSRLSASSPAGSVARRSNEITRALIVKATRERRFVPRAVRVDSTVIEADVKLPDRRRPGGRGVRALAQGGPQAGHADQGEEADGCGIARARWVASCAR